MSSKISMTESIRQLVHNKGVSEELILKIVEEALLAAYKRKFGSTDNAKTMIDEENGEMSIYSIKEVVDEVTDDLTEISLEDAKSRNPNCEIGNEVLIEIRPESFDRIAIQTAKQVVLQNLRNIERNLVYSEYKTKEGALVTGTYQRERHGNIYVDMGRVEAFLPKREQSPRENYSQGDKIKAVILEVREAKSETQIILSRVHANFIKRIFEIEVPEIADRTVEIMSIAREAGYRTKIAVYSRDIDPVGACVGMKGMRIQNIVKELEGEKIDIVRFTPDSREYIKNALTPAVIEKVVIANEEDKKAIAVVDEKQLVLAIGKQGQNVKLASRLTGWNIDIKTVEQFSKEEVEEAAVKRAREYFVVNEDTHDLSLLAGQIANSVLKKLEDSGILTIEDLIDKTAEDLMKIPGIGQKTADSIIKVLKETIEYEDETKAEPVNGTEAVKEVYEEMEVYQCPNCSTEITENMKVCPGCGAEIEFE